MHVLDDPGLSPRVRGLLERRGRRVPATSTERILSGITAVDLEERPAVVPAGAAARLVAFEERYGGLVYEVPGRPNGMECGLDGCPQVYLTDLGWAFCGVVDGSLTAPLDVLLADGGTAARLGNWPQRRTDRSVDQRLENHALLAQVTDLRHHALAVRTRPFETPDLGRGLPPAVPEASGPADCWWTDDDVAVWLHLSGWPADHDRWSITVFDRSSTAAAGDTARGLRDLGLAAADWCTLCARPGRADAACSERRSR